MWSSEFGEVVLRRGSKGKKVRFLQEWLCLHGFFIVLDGDFGPATERAVKDFQKKARLPVTGVAESGTLDRLILPITNALKPIPVRRGGGSVGSMLLAYAEQHLAQHPREIGAENQGPWVRLYTGGKEGPAWPWCAAFASFLLKQACGTLGMALPIRTSFSCDLLAAEAKRRKRLLVRPVPEKRAQIGLGSIFLVRPAGKDYIHAGVVVHAEPEYFTTIEGNTNDHGDREGYEVCKRTRGYRNKDFILI